MRTVDVAVIGGGPAGMAAAVSAKKAGAKNVLIIERNDHLGGILNQCIHTGFGLELFKQDLTGPEYAQKYVELVKENKIDCLLNTSVLKLTKHRVLTVCNSSGLSQIKANAVVLAMGCRERTRGMICIAGSRPAGVYTAGVVQNLINLQGKLPGKEVVILGSGDVGLIMARRLTLEGCKVKAVVELLPYSSGLPRNIVQCLEDYNIPLLLGHTVTNVYGSKRVEAVSIAKVDRKFNPLSKTEKKIKCDTLVLSVGLIPENELSEVAGVLLDDVTSGAIVDDTFETSVAGVFSCGNVLHVHDIVDYASAEAEVAGESAALYAQKRLKKSHNIRTKPSDHVRYVVPQKLSTLMNPVIFFRVERPFRKKHVIVKADEKVICRRFYERLNPAEMVRLNLDMGKLESINAITVGVEDA